MLMWKSRIRPGDLSKEGCRDIGNEDTKALRENARKLTFGLRKSNSPIAGNSETD